MLVKPKKLVIVVLFIILIILLLPQKSVVAQPLGWSEDVRLTHNTNNSVHPVVGVWENYVHVFWLEQIPGPGSEYDIFYKRSTDAGKTWEDTKKLIDTDKVLGHLSVALNRSTIHLVWWDKRSGSDKIYYTKSNNSGQNWEIERDIISPSSGKEPNIAICGNNLHVVYMNDFKLYYVNSTDNGISWSEAQQLTGSIRDSAHPTIAVNESNIHITWMDHSDKYGNPTAGAIFYMNSTDGGLTWSEDINLTEMDLDATFPYIEVNMSIIHVVYSKEITGLWQGYYRRSEDNGNTWSEEIKILNSSNDIYVDSFSIEKDEIHVVGGTFYISDEEIYYVKGYNNGQNWDPHIRVTYSPGNSQRANIIAYNNTLHVVWQDYRDGDGDPEIYYKQYPIYADLLISPDDITFSDNIPNTGMITQINATIQNIGDENASATIEFWDGNPNSGGVFINSTNVTVNIMESANAMINWIPITNGTHDIYVKITNTLETNLSNNIANKSVLVNREPELNSIPSTYTLNEDSIENQLINLTEYASDDLDSWNELTFNVISYSNSSIVNVSIFDGHFLSVDVLTGSVNDNWNGTLEIVIEVIDTLGLTNVSNQFKVAVIEVNDAPLVLNPLTDFEIEEDTSDSASVNLTNIFFDSDNSSLYYTYLGNINICVIIHDNGSVTFTPSENWTGSEIITFYATDNLTTPISAEVTITVIGINDPPIITILSPSNNSNHMTSDMIYFNITVFDVDSNSFTYLWDFGDGTTSILKNTTHQFSEAGIYNVTITVNDGLDSETKVVTIIVEPKTTDGDENGVIDDEDESDNLTYLWILMVIIIVVLLLFFFIWRRAKTRKDNSDIENSVAEDGKELSE